MPSALPAHHGTIIAPVIANLRCSFLASLRHALSHIFRQLYLHVGCFMLFPCLIIYEKSCLFGQMFVLVYVKILFIFYAVRYHEKLMHTAELLLVDKFQFWCHFRCITLTVQCPAYDYHFLIFALYFCEDTAPGPAVPGRQSLLKFYAYHRDCGFYKCSVLSIVIFCVSHEHKDPLFLEGCGMYSSISLIAYVYSVFF